MKLCCAADTMLQPRCIILLQLCVFGCVAVLAAGEQTHHLRRKHAALQYRSERRARFTRMSIVDFWRRETNGDGMYIKWGHGINNWKTLIDHLHGFPQRTSTNFPVMYQYQLLYPAVSDPHHNKSYLLEGDVQLSRHPPRVPVMTQNVVKRHAPLTLKQWLNQTSSARKAIKINIRTNEAVKPSLNYLFAAKNQLESPVIIHADIWRGPGDAQKPIAGRQFIREASKRFPDATLSVGWTQPVYPELIPDHENRYTWRDIFDMMQDTYNIHQPVMFSVRASLVQHSVSQLLWLLGIRSSFSLHLWSDGDDVIHRWSELVKLRKYADPRQIIYDLRDEHKRKLMQYYETLAADVYLEPTQWHQFRWRTVEFTPSTTTLSTVIKGATGAALLGWPTAFLLSELTPVGAGYSQYISGEIQFLPKTHSHAINVADETGLSVLLLRSVDDLPSPRIQGGIQIFIGYNGYISIENRDYFTQFQYAASPHSFSYRLIPKAITQLPQSPCYRFTIRDSNTYIDVDVQVVSDCLGRDMYPASARSSSASSRRKHRKIITAHQTLQLRVPAVARQRNVILQKQGEPDIDMMVQNLQHVSDSGWPSVAHSSHKIGCNTIYRTTIIAVVSLLYVMCRI